MEHDRRQIGHSIAGVDGGRAVDRPEASFEDFYRAEHVRLFRALCLLTGDPQEGEEIMQDSFVKVLERWPRVSIMDRREGYLYRVAMNEFRSRYRRTLRSMRRVMFAGEPPDPLSAVEDTDAVISALRMLIPQQRAAVVLTSLLGYSSEEAGQILGMKASTVRALGTRARMVMRATAGGEG